MSRSPRLETPGGPAASPAGNSYDEVPYESHPYAQTHPSRLATVATLFGLTPPPVESCRVLELGCAAGGNLIPMAEALPGSWFVGIDLSGRQIGDGERLVRTLGLRNISLRHASVHEVDDSYGRFDYILCHGVFSWVADATQDKILEICSQNLSPHGVAYVSYNTYPGWHLRGMIRDMMRYHALRFATPDQRVQQARALLDFLAQSARQDGGPYTTLLRQELELLRQHADHYLYHEHLEDINAPLYFHHFIDRARRHRLRYLGEARLTTMVMGNFTPDVQKALETVADDQIQAEQYMDFVRNRTFRETLLVRAERAPNWAIRPAAVYGLHVTTTAKVADDPGDLHATDTVQYHTATGMTVATSSPIMKAAMRALSMCWPGTFSFEELHRTVQTLLGAEADARETLAMGLLNTYLASDLVEFRALTIAPGSLGEKPRALASLRARLAAGETTAANRRHDVFRANELDQKLLPLVDGSRGRADLLDRLTELTVQGELTVQANGEPLVESAAIRAALGPLLDKTLAGYAAAALLG